MPYGVIPRCTLSSVLPLVMYGALLCVFACTNTKEKTTNGIAKRSSLPVIKPAPEFSGVAQTGGQFHSASLRGSVWIVYFFFTSCGGPCPAMNARVAQLQKELPSPQLKFVGISVDPETDTPPVLLRYATRYDADSLRWVMLTMPLDSVKAVAVKGFMLAQGAESDPNLHSTRFVLVDTNGMIRGYYNGLEDNDLAKLRTAIAEVLAEHTP
ncbi:MAG: SCO family protein [Bacteroidota bacterium]|nr:SCO family protein [Candidatus Kapabacteria bacterium]MDW8219111.1 SCO family protein [Bacteroidota bacterium]